MSIQLSTLVTKSTLMNKITKQKDVTFFCCARQTFCANESDSVHLRNLYQKFCSSAGNLQYILRTMRNHIDQKDILSCCRFGKAHRAFDMRVLLPFVILAMAALLAYGCSVTVSGKC